MTSTGDLAANLDCALVLLEEAAGHGADLLAYPEVFTCIAGRDKKLSVAEALDGPIVSMFREQAARRGLMILLGSLHERIPGHSERVHNTSVLIGSDGALLASYRKRKLFDVDLPGVRIRESETIVAGEARSPVVETAIGRIALTICFDCVSPRSTVTCGRGSGDRLRALQLHRADRGGALGGPAARPRHRESGVRSRARPGRPAHPRYRSHGHSMVVDPWGRVLAERAAASAWYGRTSTSGRSTTCARSCRWAEPRAMSCGLGEAGRMRRWKRIGGQSGPRARG